MGGIYIYSRLARDVTFMREIWLAKSLGFVAVFEKMAANNLPNLMMCNIGMGDCPDSLRKSAVYLMNRHEYGEKVALDPFG